MSTENLGLPNKALFMQFRGKSLEKLFSPAPGTNGGKREGTLGQWKPRKQAALGHQDQQPTTDA